MSLSRDGPLILRYERVRPPSLWHRWRLRAALAFVVLAGGLSVVIYRTGKGMPVVVVPVFVESADDGLDHLTSRGVLVANIHGAYPVIRGRVAALGVSRGNNVRAAGIIGRLENRETGIAAGVADSTLNRVRAALVTAQASHDSAAIRRAIQNLDAALRSAQDAGRVLENTYVTSPVTGVVLRRLAEKGALVAPQGQPGAQALVEVADLSTLYFRTLVPAARGPQLHVGDRAVVALDSLRLNRFAGVVDEVNPHSRDSVEVRVTLDVSDRRTLPGLAGAAQLIAHVGRRTTRPRRVLVPSVAVRRDEGQMVVWLVRDNRIERRVVDAVPDTAGMHEVRAGLTGGELVVVEAPSPVKGGIKVVPRSAPRRPVERGAARR